MTQSKILIEFRERDEFDVVPGSGWVLTENGKRLDWPMLNTRIEAVADRIGFYRERRQLASDEASERRGLHSMGA